MVMGGNGEMEKTLAITFKADTGTQVDVASGGGSKGGTTEPAGGGKGKKDKEDEAKKQGASLKKLVGIDISIAAMLKQSQIFPLLSSFSKDLKLLFR